MSKDRTLSLFENVSGSYELRAKSEPCARIIYSCDITTDESLIVTGSRDKKVRVLTIPQLSRLLEFNVGIAVTAVSITDYRDKRVISIGLESGAIVLYWLAASELVEIGRIGVNHCANGSINRLVSKTLSTGVWIACCSDDHTVRIYTIEL